MQPQYLLNLFQNSNYSIMKHLLLQLIYYKMQSSSMFLQFLLLNQQPYHMQFRKWWK